MPTSGTAAPQAAALQKFAVAPAPTFKRPKLWNRFDPLWVPPVMLHVPPRHGVLVDPFTAVPRPLDVMFVPTWALLGGAIKLKAERNMASATTSTSGSPFSMLICPPR